MAVYGVSENSCLQEISVNGTNADIAFLEAFDGYVICV